MGFYEIKEQKLVYHNGHEVVIIEPWGPNSLRVRATESAQMPEINWALSEAIPEAKPVINLLENNAAEIINGKIRAHINLMGKVSFYNEKNELLLEEFLRDRSYSKDSQTCSSLYIQPREFKPIAGESYELTVHFESDPEEKIYGMGQYQQDIFNLKGAYLELAQRNTQCSVPFYTSNLGYGFLWNNPSIGNVFFGTNETRWFASCTNIMDYWITAGDTPSEIQESYIAVTGKPPMMPDYAMGFWQCKARYETQDELMSVAREYHKRHIPLSVIVIDFLHWEKQGDWDFDRKYWPDPEGMIKELTDMGIKLMVSVWPTVDRQSRNYREMSEKGYLVRTERGINITLAFKGNTLYFDTTNPDAQKFVWSKVKENYYDKGIKTFWLDEAEPEYSVYDFDNYRYYLGSNMQVGNIYPLTYAKGFYDGMTAEGDDKVLNLIRCAWAGSQKYGTLVWSGDIKSDFLIFRQQVTAGLHMAMAGISWWTTDIGGLMAGYIEDPHFRELFARWFAYGAFCPVMRMHGSRESYERDKKIMDGFANISRAPNEIWCFGDRVYEICKKYIYLRECLRPYITRHMEQTHLKGTPIMRPLFYDFPADQSCWDIRDEYMFGSDILVAPVMYEGMEERSVYLPEDRTWYNAWTGEACEGGSKVTVATPLEIMPVFVTDQNLLKFFADAMDDGVYKGE